ncbi:MAG: ABC transporter ATP-binding protein [Planctomycetaceae bacterium]|nr:ABC transporter ATP-binding protein [Planctomycetaceae bacterium]
MVSARPNSTLIELSDVRKTYLLGEVELPVLKGVSLTIEAGELVALMGASGSGKTTLMNLLGCLDRPTGGSYTLDGEAIGSLSPDRLARIRGKKIGFVFQNFNLLARTSAIDNVLMPLEYAAPRPPAAEARERAIELLRRVGLGERLDHEPSQMSGGQQQRVAIARSLINNPKLLLADEPTGNLDSKTSREILALFQELNAEEGLTIMLVTHDPGVGQATKRRIVMRDGLIADDDASH